MEVRFRIPAGITACCSDEPSRCTTEGAKGRGHEEAAAKRFEQEDFLKIQFVAAVLQQPL